jgi:hypothetical protein
MLEAAILSLKKKLLLEKQEKEVIRSHVSLQAQMYQVESAHKARSRPFEEDLRENMEEINSIFFKRTNG